MDQADEAGDGAQFFMGRVRAALRSSIQRTYWRDRRSGSIGSASRTGSSFPLVKPTHLWNFGRLFSGSWLTQLLKLVAGSFASRKATRSMSIFWTSILA